jgi:Protein of unknown function (DUF3455)
MMTQREHAPRFLSSMALLLTAAGCSTDLTAPEPVALETDALSIRCAPEVADVLKVPAGNLLAFAAVADGVQIYSCQVDAAGAASWTLKAPDARLYGRRGNVIGHHYAGPTWEALDGSTVVGSRLASVSGEPTAIPWLLLQSNSHTGHGLMSDVTYVQRLDTTEGVAPQAGCDAEHVAATVSVDYTATYYFYKAAETSTHR